jgi:hypothetical protein
MSCHYTSDGLSVCCADREMTAATCGVWTSCDACGHDWWCVVSERDYLDEPIAWTCSDGCPDDECDEYEDEPASGRTA